MIEMVFTVYGVHQEYFHLRQEEVQGAPAHHSEMPSPNFMLIALTYFDANRATPNASHLLRFIACFGVSARVVGDVWIILKEQTGTRYEPKHLLWALLKMKTYATDYVCSSIVRCDRNTYQKWVWKVINSLSKLGQVRCIY